MVNLWEVDVSLAFQPSLRPLLPFVPLLRGGDNEAVVEQALRVLRADERRHGLEPLLAHFASFVMDVQRV